MTDTERQRVGVAVTAARLGRWMSQTEAAFEIGVSATTLSRIECAEARVCAPSQESLDRALAWADRTHEQDGATKRKYQTEASSRHLPIRKPKHQRPMADDVWEPAKRKEETPDSPPFYSTACPLWGAAQTAISHTTCTHTARRTKSCAACPGLAMLIS